MHVSEAFSNGMPQAAAAAEPAWRPGSGMKVDVDAACEDRVSRGALPFLSAETNRRRPTASGTIEPLVEWVAAQSTPNASAD